MKLPLIMIYPLWNAIGQRSGGGLLGLGLVLINLTDARLKVFEVFGEHTLLGLKGRPCYPSMKSTSCVGNVH